MSSLRNSDANDRPSHASELTGGAPESTAANVHAPSTRHRPYTVTERPNEPLGGGAGFVAFDAAGAVAARPDRVCTIANPNAATWQLLQFGRESAARFRFGLIS